MINRIVMCLAWSPVIGVGMIAVMSIRFFQFGWEVGDSIIKSAFNVTGTVSGS